MPTPSLLAAMRSALALVESAAPSDWASASDTELRHLISATAALERASRRHAAFGAGEVARRSGPELGLAGFAQRAGHRTTEEFLKVETGVTGRDAATSVRVGMLGGALGDALRSGRVGVPAAEAIRAGLGSPTGLPSDVMDEAAARLCEDAASIDPDRLQRRAREVRDELDEAGIGDREKVRRDSRSLRLVKQPDGMTRIAWLLDPESAAIVTGIYDRATSPRRGGPRFVDSAAREKAARVADDDRNTEQLASDAFTELLRQAGSVDTSVLLGGEEPSVRVLVSAEVLTSGQGHGILESGEAIGLPTVQRLACAGGVLPIIIDGAGQVLDLGRKNRLFNRTQRRALSARDGGCMWPSCDRPPSWTEAHHIRRWADGGRTDLADGISLCRHHHLRLHDDGWAIRRQAGRYWLTAPPGSSMAGALLETKSRAVREFLAVAN